MISTDAIERNKGLQRQPCNDASIEDHVLETQPTTRVRRIEQPPNLPAVDSTGLPLIQARHSQGKSISLPLNDLRKTWETNYGRTSSCQMCRKATHNAATSRHFPKTSVHHLRLAFITFMLAEILAIGLQTPCSLDMYKRCGPPIYPSRYPLNWRITLVPARKNQISQGLRLFIIRSLVHSNTQRSFLLTDGMEPIGGFLKRRRRHGQKRDIRTGKPAEVVLVMLILMPAWNPPSAMLFSLYYKWKGASPLLPYVSVQAVIPFCLDHCVNFKNVVP